MGMAEQKRPPAKRGNAGAQTKTIGTAEPTKLRRVLEAFARGDSFNRFEAEQFGDHTLPSTVAAIQGRFQLQVARERETVPGRGGHPTTVTRYWLEPAEREKARQLLGGGRP